MAGVILEGDKVVDVGVEEKARPAPPPPDPATAPKGWRWDRDEKTYVPRLRAPKVAGDGDDDDPDGEDSGSGAESAWATAPDEPSPVAVLTDEQRSDVEAILELIVLPVLVSAERADPYCGAALVDNWDEIRKRSIPIIARSPALVEWLTKAGGARDFIMLAAALRPVATAVVRHHVTRTVTVGADGVPGEEDLAKYAA